MSIHRHRVVQGNAIGNSNFVFSRVRSIDPNCLKTTNHSVMLSDACVSEFSQYMGYASKKGQILQGTSILNCLMIADNNYVR